jgi:hypothetical protein
MGIAIVWQPGLEGGQDLWLSDAGRPHLQLLAVDTLEGRETVERWAVQADSVPEFLEMLHLEGLMDLDRYQALVRQHDPLYAAACAVLACLPHRRIGERMDDPPRELYPLIECMTQALEAFVAEPIARAIIADALGTYWASWIGRREDLDHDVNAARQALNEVLTGASSGVRILQPGDLVLTPEAVRAMIGYVLETQPRGDI